MTFSLLAGLGCSDGGGSPGDAGVDAFGVGDAAVLGGSCASAPGESFDPLATYVAPPHASTVMVTTVADSGAGSLRAAVATGGVVGFSSSLAGMTITLGSPIEMGPSVIVDGSGARGLVIDAAQKGGAFHFNGDAPTKLGLFALIIKNGHTMGSGGAISVNGGAVELEVGGVRFESNVAGEGGAIRAGYRSAQVFIHDSVFVGNDGSIANNGFSGGAVSANGGNLHVLRCRFESNIGTTSGAVYAIHANPVIEDSVFIKNKSAGQLGSGAFFADGGGPGDYTNGDQTPGEITLRRSLFIQNRGAGDDSGGGELYAYPPDTVTVEGCTFRDNESNPGRAGALFIHADKVVMVTKTAFIDNHATGSGGAIWADGSATYTFENTLFSGNKCDTDLGGALRMNISDQAKLRISSSTFVDNTATGNGALWLPGVRDVHVTNSIFANNTGRSGAQQVNFPITDDGGNLEWPDPRTMSTLAKSTIADPMLAALSFDQGSWVRAPGAAAIDQAVLPAPLTDQRGARRDAKPDVGSYEHGATCQ